MNDLIIIPGSISGQPVPTIDARHLHDRLGVQTEFKDWMPRRIEQLNLKNGNDFEVLLKSELNPLGGRPAQNYLLTLRAAIRIAVAERNERGDQVRDQLVDHLLAAESRPAPMSDDELLSRAVIVAQSAIQRLEADKARQAQVIEAQAARIEADKPKVAWAETAEKAETDILIGTLAGLLSKRGVDIGQNRLFEWMRHNGYLCDHGKRYNKPTQKAKDLGVLTFYESPIRTNHGIVLKTTPLVTPKGQAYFIGKFIEADLPVLINEETDAGDIPEPQGNA